MRRETGYWIIVLILMLICTACSPAFNFLDSSPDVSRSNMYEALSTAKMILVIHGAVLVVSLLITLLSRILSTVMLVIVLMSSMLFAERTFCIWRDMIGLHTSDAISVRGDIGGLLFALIFVFLISIVVLGHRVIQFEKSTAPTTSKKPPKNYFEEWD